MRPIDADALEEALEKIPAADIKNIDGQAYVLVRLSEVLTTVRIAAVTTGVIQKQNDSI